MHIFHKWKRTSLEQYVQKPDLPIGMGAEDAIRIWETTAGFAMTRILETCQKPGCTAVRVKTIKGHWEMNDLDPK
jgi:hypothetical protein